MCKVTDCVKKVHSKGMCQAHYRLMKKYGNTEGIPREQRRKPGPKPDPDKPVAPKRIYVKIGDTCPSGHLLTEENTYSYPETAVLKGRVVCKICRMNWQRKRKGIPESDSIGTWNKNKTHCPKGHEYTLENTRALSDGSRSCRLCHARNTRRRAYGLEWEDFEKMWSKQGQKCAICKIEFSSTKDACVDHNHTSGKIRGLLCNNCNNGLGRFLDNTENLKEAIKYLKMNERAPTLKK